MTTLADMGEIEMVRRLCARLASRGDVIVGPGDDCAVVRPRPEDAEDLLLTSDPTIEGVHFAPGTDGRRIGHKAMARVLSDIAAMGGDPAWALVDVAAPPSTSAGLIDAIYDGMTAVAARHGLVIVGGDVAVGPVLELHVFGCGRTARGQALTRSGARPGDLLCVTGHLGGSGAGHHLDFEPRLAEGRVLRGRATACMDLSDGLAADLPRLARASGAGACVTADAVPISRAAREATDGRSPLDHALADGEDFELLFTIPPSALEALRSAWSAAGLAPFHGIGAMTNEPGIVRVREARGLDRPLREKGYEHFHG